MRLATSTRAQATESSGSQSVSMDRNSAFSWVVWAPLRLARRSPSQAFTPRV